MSLIEKLEAAEAGSRELDALTDKIEHGDIRALSIRQPWCHNILHVIPCKGSLGFFRPPVEVKAACIAALRAQEAG